MACAHKCISDDENLHVHLVFVCVQMGKCLCMISFLFSSRRFLYTPQLLIVFGLFQWTNRTFSFHMGCREQWSHKIRAQNSALGRGQTVKRGGGGNLSLSVLAWKNEPPEKYLYEYLLLSCVNVYCLNMDFRNPLPHITTCRTKVQTWQAWISDVWVLYMCLYEYEYVWVGMSVCVCIWLCACVSRLL